MSVDNGLYLGMNAKPIQDIFTQSATFKHPLGSFFDDEYGRRFRYALNGAGALVAGDIVQSAALGGAATTLQAIATVAVAAPQGDKRIYVCAGTTAQDLDRFAEGWAAFYDASLVAVYTRRVKANSALATSGVASYIDLYEDLPVALTTSDYVALMTNPYYNIIQIPAATPTGIALGGVHCAVTAAYYAWVQTRGWFGVHIKDGAFTAGLPAVLGGTTVGTLTSNSETLYNQHIAQVNGAWNDEKSGLVFLMCE